jgi:short-subunit dehydrogenase
VVGRGLHVEVLVNNAGLLEFGAFMETPPERLSDMLELNVVALTALSRAFVPPMIEAGFGRVLNLASVAAFLPMPSLAAYAATKAYILALSEALAEELRDTGVSVTVCCPGLTDTEMVAKVQVVERLRGIVPSILFPLMDARSVAREAFEACMRGETVHVAGLTNRLAVSLLGSPHNPLVRWLGGAIGRRVM